MSNETNSIRPGSAGGEPPSPGSVEAARSHSFWGPFYPFRRAVLIICLALALIVVLASLSARAREALLLGLFAQRTLAGLLLLFLLVALSLLWSAGQRLDAAVFLYFNRHKLRTPMMDHVMWITTQIGNGGFGLSLALVFYAAGFRRLAVEMALGILTVWMVVELIKALTDRARPYLILAGAQVVGWRERGKSFPSGHTTQTFFMMSLFTHYFQLPAWFSLLLFLIALLVGFTRVYVGAHYPRDVLAGAILGTVWGILTLLVDPFLYRRLF